MPRVDEQVGDAPADGPTNIVAPVMATPATPINTKRLPGMHTSLVRRRADDV
jgi:hypothetical protein